MQLSEFIREQKQLLDDFDYQYNERRKRGKEHTLFRPESQWIELIEEFLTHRRSMLIEDEDNEQEAAAEA